MTIAKCLTELHAKFIPDILEGSTVACHIEVDGTDEEQPVHQHQSGQLVFVDQGGMICDTHDSIWFIPSQCAMWIPGGIPHHIRVKDCSNSYFLFVKPDKSCLPSKCCMLSITPLIRQKLISFADGEPVLTARDLHVRLAEFLLELLATAPTVALQIPTSSHPIIRILSNKLTDSPGDRTTMAQWAAQFGLSERSFARLVVKETRLTFGRWRQYFQLFSAMQQLKSGATVNSVALQLGYDSTTAFITMFKKAVGDSPAHYFSSILR